MIGWTVACVCSQAENPVLEAQYRAKPLVSWQKKMESKRVREREWSVTGVPKSSSTSHI